jgi:HEAT repeat protein
MFASSAGFVAAALQDLRSGNRHRQQTALSIIIATWQAADRPAELRREVVKLLEVDDPFVPGQAARALGAVGTAEDLPALEKTLASAQTRKDFGLEVACKEAIEKLKKR